MSDYIRREDAVDAMCKATCGGKDGCPAYPCEETIQPLIDLPSVDVVQVRHGRWTHKPNIYGVAYCSECDYELRINNASYCPNCGAKMDTRGEE